MIAILTVAAIGCYDCNSELSEVTSAICYSKPLSLHCVSPVCNSQLDIVECPTDVSVASSACSYPVGPHRGDALSLNASPSCDVDVPLVPSADVEIGDPQAQSIDGQCEHDTDPVCINTTGEPTDPVLGCSSLSDADETEAGNCPADCHYLSRSVSIDIDKPGLDETRKTEQCANKSNDSGPDADESETKIVEDGKCASACLCAADVGHVNCKSPCSIGPDAQENQVCCSSNDSDVHCVLIRCDGEESETAVIDRTCEAHELMACTTLCEHCLQTELVQPPYEASDYCRPPVEKVGYDALTGEVAISHTENAPLNHKSDLKVSVESNEEVDLGATDDEIIHGGSDDDGHNFDDDFDVVARSYQVDPHT